MADNVTIPTTGTGTATPVVATDDVAGVHYQKMKIYDGTDSATAPLTVAVEDVASAGAEGGILAMGIRKDVPAALGADLDFTYAQFDKYGKQWVAGAYPEDTASADLDPIVVMGARRTATPANQSGTDGDYEPLQMDAGKLWTKPLGSMVTRSTTVTRAANVTTYTAADNVGSTPSGGYTITDAARVSGGSGIITDMFVQWDDITVTKMQGEVWITDSSITETADNAALTLTDTEAKTVVGIIPFVLFAGPSGDMAHVQNLSVGFTTSGSANLRFAVITRSACIPIANSSILTFRFKILQVD